MKGIILCGGLGSRLYPATFAGPKALLPIYDKPMIYYPLSTLLQARIRDVLVICTNRDKAQFQRLLGDGSNLGINISYAVEEKPLGSAMALIIGKEFIGNDPVCLIFGDNIFFGEGLREQLTKSAQLKFGCELYAMPVPDPERFGVAYEEDGIVQKIIEKPKNPTSNLAVTGLYFYDNNVVDIAKNLVPSARGEYEITDVNNVYVQQKNCKLNKMNKGVSWLDTGTHESLFAAAEAVKHMQENGKFVGCVEVEAYKSGFIGLEELLCSAEQMSKTAYGKHLKEFVERQKCCHNGKFC